MRTGILGGTFDPIHLGHLEAADAARRSLQLDRVVLLPSRTPPHRSVEPRASVYHRFAMGALAAAERGMLISDLELQREGPSYTALTLEALHREGYAPGELFFITGSDAFAEIATWFDYPRLFSLSNFAIVPRPGFPVVIPQSLMTPSSTSVVVIDATTPDVSSTEIRRRVAAAEPIDDLVGRAVADHIGRHRLYLPRGRGCRAMTGQRKTASRRFPAQVQRAITAAQDRKAGDVVVLDLRSANGFADYFLICSGTNPRQIKAISDSIQEALAERGLKPAHVEGYDHAGWILLDYFDFIAHIFSPDARAFYSLERLWGNAKRIEVPEPEPPGIRE